MGSATKESEPDPRSIYRLQRTKLRLKSNGGEMEIVTDGTECQMTLLALGNSNPTGYIKKKRRIGRGWYKESKQRCVCVRKKNHGCQEIKKRHGLQLTQWTQQTKKKGSQRLLPKGS